MFVREAMTSNVLTATPTTPISQVARDMASQDVGTAVIVEGSRPVGIVTDRDIVINHVAKGHFHDCPVSEAMTGSTMMASLVTISPDSDILDAARELGRQRVGRLLVVENDKLMGILSAGDVTRELKKALDGLLTEGEKADKS